MIFVDECSSKTGQNVEGVFMNLIQAIYNNQMEQVKTGKIKLENLRLKDDDTALNYKERCCY